MRNLWRNMLDRIRPSRNVPTSRHARRVLFLHIVIVVVIVLVGGPEVIAAMEMMTLLEILGATLFLTAYISAAKLMGLALVRALRNAFLSLAPRIERRVRPALYASASTALWLAFAIGA